MSRRSKYVPSECEDVREWIQTVTKEKLPDGDPIEILKDGVVLCKVANVIQPNSAKFKISAMPFVKMENIASFLRACSRIGVEQHELFETVDLYEMKDPIQVAITIRSLSRHAHLLNDDLPVIGPKFKRSESIKKTPEKPLAPHDRFFESAIARSPQTGGTPVGTPAKDSPNQNKETEAPSINNDVNLTTYPNAEPSVLPPSSSEKVAVEDHSWKSSPFSRQANDTVGEGEFSFEQSESESSALHKPTAIDKATVSNSSDSKTWNENDEPHEKLSASADSSYINQRDDEDSLSEGSTVNTDGLAWRKGSIAKSEVADSPEDVKPMSAFSPSPEPAKPQDNDLDSPTRESKPFSLNMRPNRPKGPREQGNPSPTLQNQTSVFESDDDDDDDNYQTGKINFNAFRGKVNKQLIDYGKRSIKETEEYENDDGSLYDYDGVYDVMKQAERAVQKKDTIEKQARKSKYIGNLLESKTIRDRDRQRAKDIQIQRERDAEGDEFADKEMFITSAYKKQQEDLERERAEQEKEAKMAGKMQSFHRNVLAQEAENRAGVLKAISEAKGTGKSSVFANTPEEDDSLAAKARKINENAGYEKVKVNEEGELINSTELLSGGLNVVTRPKETSSQSFQQEAHGSTSFSNQSKLNASGIRRTRHDYGHQMKTVAQEEQHKRQTHTSELKASLTSSKIDNHSVLSARERFLARKKLAQSAKNDELPHKSPSKQ